MIYPPAVSSAHFAILSALLFALAMAGLFLNRKNLIVMLMCVELMLLAVNFKSWRSTGKTAKRGKHP